MDRGTPDLVRHCVAAVAKKDGDTERAFAICVSQLQKNGYLEPGTMNLTAAGREKEKEHEGEPDAAKKLASYEKILKAARKEEGRTGMSFALREASETLGQLNLSLDGSLKGPTRYYNYNRTFNDDQHYFSPREKLKNGTWKGFTVVDTLKGRAPKKAKTEIIQKMDFGNFDLIDRKDLDPEVADRFDDVKEDEMSDTRKKDTDPHFFEMLVRPTTSSGYESVPHAVARRQTTQDESPMEKMRRLAGITRTGAKIHEDTNTNTNTKAVDTLVAKLRQMSSDHDYAGALVEMAKFSKDKGLLKAAQGIRMIRDEIGTMPAVEDLSDKIRKMIVRKITDENGRSVADRIEMRF